MADDETNSSMNVKSKETEWMTAVEDAETEEELGKLEEKAAAAATSPFLRFAITQKRRALQWERKGNEERRKRQKTQKIQDGTYYSRIDQVFVKDTLPFIGGKDDPEEFNRYKSCCRSIQDQKVLDWKWKCRPHSSESNHQNPYACTYNATNESDYTPAADENTTRSSTHSRKKEQIWKTNVFGINAINGDIAHLVPAAVKTANSYWFVTEFLFGVNASESERCNLNRSWKQILQLVHGSKKRGNKQNKPSRETDTGIKHMITNKIVLCGQKKYLDLYPCVLIVPILTLEETREWKGNGYDAIFLIDSYNSSASDASDTDNNMGSIHSYESIPLDAVARGTEFSCLIRDEDVEENKTTATESELQTAEELLRMYTRAILHAQRDRKPKEVETLLSDLNITLATALTTFYPKLSSNSQNLKVRKVHFHDNAEEGGHPAPDPILLVTRAVEILQRRHGHRIVAKAEEEDYRSELSVQAEEEFLRWREAMQPKTNPVGLDIVIP